MRTAIVVTACLAAAPAAAAPGAAVPATTWRDGMMDDGETCFLSRDYAGSVLLIVLAQRSGAFWIGAGSPDWPLKDGVFYTVRAQLDGTEAKSVSRVPTHSAGRRGFVISVSARFMRRLAKAKQFELSYGASEPIAFDLAGAGAGVERLGSCQRRLRATAPSAATLPAPPRGYFFDPFRRDAAFPRGARLTSGSIAGLFTDRDYPVEARRARQSGSVQFLAKVGTNGSVAECTIVASSGSAALDSATCRIIKERARFIPALDDGGRPTTDTGRGIVHWSLPGR